MVVGTVDLFRIDLLKNLDNFKRSIDPFRFYQSQGLEFLGFFFLTFASARLGASVPDVKCDLVAGTSSLQVILDEGTKTELLGLGLQGVG